MNRMYYVIFVSLMENNHLNFAFEMRFEVNKSKFRVGKKESLIFQARACILLKKAVLNKRCDRKHLVVKAKNERTCLLSIC